MCPEYANMFHTDSGVERRFIVAGFPSPIQFRLVPSVIAEEGLSKMVEQGLEVPPKVEKMFKLHTFVPVVNKIGHVLEQ